MAGMKWTAQMLIGALEITALRRSGEFGHRLGGWVDAKRKLGKGAKKATCVTCGKHALLTPNGYQRGKNKAVKNTPGIRGDAVFEPCVEPMGPHSEHISLGRML